MSRRLPPAAAEPRTGRPRNPPWEKFLHWLHFAAMMVLIVSGFAITYANRAFGFPTMRSARQWHFYAMYFLVWALLARIYFLLATGAWRDFNVTRRDLADLPRLGRYYLFLDDDPPLFGKFNPGQKLMYDLWPFVLAFQALTGFLLYLPDRWESLWLHPWLLNLNTLRTIHFFTAWFFVATVAMHLYLVLIEGLDALKEMLPFTRRRR